MLRAGGNQINAGGFDATVAQYIRQFRRLPADTVKDPGEQVPQIVGEHFGGLHARPTAEGLHLCPDLLAEQVLSASGEKDLPGGGFVFSGILQQLPAQSAGNENGTDLALQGDLRSSLPGGLRSDIPHLADPDAGGTDGLLQQSKALLPPGPGVGEQAVVLLTGQFPAVLPEQAVLELQELHAACILAQKWNRPLIAASMELMVTGA